MDELMRSLVRDCLGLMAEASLRQCDLADLLGVTRVVVSRWQGHLKEGGSWDTLPVTGRSPATLFMNLLIVRRLLEDGMDSGALPVRGIHGASRWVQNHLPGAPGL